MSNRDGEFRSECVGYSQPHGITNYNLVDEKSELLERDSVELVSTPELTNCLRTLFTTSSQVGSRTDTVHFSSN